MASAKWTKVYEAEILQRSSQVVSFVNDHIYIFGGEFRPREPCDNVLHVLSLNENFPPQVVNTSSEPPAPRVGAASTTLAHKIYLFAGRGGTAMDPIDEEGAIWEFDTLASTWTPLVPEEPVPSSSTDSCPVARSYHCMTNDGSDTIYLHGGCPEKGELCDLWAFCIPTRNWMQMASAPDPPRGGASITYANGLLYRMNGFDGKTEQGGKIDVYSPETNEWSSMSYSADGTNGPVPRSVGALLPVRIEGRLYLLTFFGEGDPSAQGHQGAGKMLGDIWGYDVHHSIWKKLEVEGNSAPSPRGCFATDVNSNRVVVQGGLNGSNERLGDVWILSF